MGLGVLLRYAQGVRVQVPKNRILFQALEMSVCMEVLKFNIRQCVFSSYVLCAVAIPDTPPSLPFPIISVLQQERFKVPVGGFTMGGRQRSISFAFISWVPGSQGTTGKDML